MFLIAHNIRSMHNVGAIFRSADAFGVERLYLSGYTAIPPRAEISKTALGSDDRVAWEYHEDIATLIRGLKEQGVYVVGLDNRDGAVDISTCTQQPIALILGNEVEGIPDDVLALCDALVEIPMPGQKKSLNVSVATGVALFALRQQIR